MSLSVIIPSRSSDKFIRCVTAIRRHEPRLPIFAMDDGLDPGRISGSPCFCCDNAPIDVVPCPEVFNFARNMNLGIQDAGDDDVLLLNDDALLLTPGGFTAMERAARDHPEYGVISAAAEGAQACQQPHGAGLRPVDRMVAFFAALIPRRAIEAVGFLDERYAGYGHEDDDMCLRLRRAGFKIGVFDDCLVEHGEAEKSTFRSRSDIRERFMQNRYEFRLKWGMDPEVA